MTMKYKCSLLGLAAGTALLVATGCSKQEPASTAATESTTKAPASTAVSKPPTAETPKAAEKPAAVVAQPATPPVSTPMAMTPPPATTNPAPAVTAATLGEKAATAAAAVSNSVVAAISTNGSVASAAQSAVKAQQISFTQSVSNQLQTLAAAGTNQGLSGLASTNQVATATTNQVQQLLERAKTLCASQKYQDALSNLTVLYTTKLTPDQKQKADDLKAQIQTGIAQKATSALGNFLNGTK
jgi:hypothetical protein